MSSSFRWQLIEIDQACQNKINMLWVPMSFTILLVPVLIYSGRLMDSLLAILSLALFYISCYRERGHIIMNFILLLCVLTLLECVTSSMRFLLIETHSSSEMVPPHNMRRFIIFAVGVVAAPLVHFCTAFCAWQLFNQLRFTMRKWQQLAQQQMASGVVVTHDVNSSPGSNPFVISSEADAEEEGMEDENDEPNPDAESPYAQGNTTSGNKSTTSSTATAVVPATASSPSASGSPSQIPPSMANYRVPAEASSIPRTGF